MTWSSHTISSRRRRTDRWLLFLTTASAGISAAILVLVAGFVVMESAPALRRIGCLRFLTDSSWHPLSDQYNVLAMLLGTALTSAGAVLMATPFGLGSAIFDRFYAPPSLAGWYRRLVELLAGIPSVVYGLWGLIILVPRLGTLGGSGQGLLTATLILALMILPTIALTASSALGAVPRSLVVGGAALGLSSWPIAWRIAVPAARQGILAGMMLATARAIGETMAVVMVAGNVAEIPHSITAPVRTLTGNIALEMGYAAADHRAVLFVSGLALLVAVGLTLITAELFGKFKDG